ncbi:MAG: hypothetical protein R2710_21740 [Acidimicrobiales bacterium]
MGDEHDGSVDADEEGLELGETGDVEVVGRFVEQEDVELGDQDDGEPDSGLLAARQARRLLVEHAGSESDAVEGGGEPLIKVGGAQAEPTVEGEVVAIGSVGSRRGQVVGGGVELSLGSSDASTVGDDVEHGGAGLGSEFLGEQSDGRGLGDE